MASHYDKGFSRLFFSNSCNGLILVGCDNSLFLSNPLTRFFQKVLTIDRLLDDGYIVLSGLCYDPSIADYKALIWLSHYGGEFLIVATLKGKRWTEIRFPFGFGFLINGPVVNGHLHWAVTKDHTYHFSIDKIRIIVRFDPVDSRFEQFPIPKPKYGEDNAIAGLGVLDGCLCLSRSNNQSDFECNFEILVMKEYGVVESWTTMFVVSNLNLNPYYGFLISLILTRNGEILVCINNEEILAYEPSKFSCRNVPFSDSFDHLYLSATSLVQSLVSPVGYSWNSTKHRKYGDF